MEVGELGGCLQVVYGAMLLQILGEYRGTAGWIHN